MINGPWLGPDLPSKVPAAQNPTLPAPRECENCFACCIWLGIDAKATGDQISLRKYTGQTCTRLNPDLGEKCCSVYDSRPRACETYSCAWKTGFGLPNERPNSSGLITTIYPLADDPTMPGSATIVVIDGTKCGDYNFGPLRNMINHLALCGITTLNIVNYKNHSVLHFHDGNIYSGHLLRGDGPEDLKFQCNPEPIGRLEIQETKDA